MASITDCVVDGLKYPFNDVKKLLCFGVLFTLINIIVVAVSVVSVDIARAISASEVNHFWKFSQVVPANDMYIVSALAIISFIISLVIMGYQYDIIKFAIDRKNDLPEFGGILNILINGVKYFIVTLVYNLIPAIVFVAGVQFLNADYIVSVIAVILFIICNFLLIMGMANMVDSGKIAKAFDVKEIIDKIANLGWVKYVGIILFTIIVYAIIMVAIGIILMLLTGAVAIAVNNAMAVAVVSAILEGLFVSPYISIFFNRVFGSVYREAIK